jgi:hypothetical protein
LSAIERSRASASDSVLALGRSTFFAKRIDEGTVCAVNPSREVRDLSTDASIAGISASLGPMCLRANVSVGDKEDEDVTERKIADCKEPLFAKEIRWDTALRSAVLLSIVNSREGFFLSRDILF